MSADDSLQADSEPSYAATFLDGWSLAETPVRVSFHAGSLRIVDLERRERGYWRRSGLHCDAMQEGGVLHVSHESAPQETLVVRDPELERRLLAISGRVTAVPGGAHKRRTALVWFLAVLSLGAGVYAAIPVLAQFVALRVPLEQERALGAQMETVLSFAGCSDPSAEAALRVIVARLSDPGTKPYEVHLMHADQPNAFALPGGLIVVTDALLTQAQSADEIAGVLAHEIEHVVQRHVLAGFLRGAVLSGLWSLTMGDYSGLLVVDPSTAYRMIDLKFSRADEQAADSFAVPRLHRAGISHQGLVRFFERLQKKYGTDGPSFWSTHPSTEARIARLRGVPDVSAPRALLTPEQFAALKHTCEKK